MPYVTTRMPTDGSNTGNYVREWERGASGVGRIGSVMQQGSRQGLVFASASPIISPAATPSLRIWALVNPTGSGKTLYVHKVIMRHWATGTAATVVTWQLARTTDEPSGGTTLTPSRINQSATAPVGVPRTLPTAGTLETGLIDAEGSEVAAVSAPRYYPMWDSSGQWDEHIEVVAARALLINTNGTPDIDHRFSISAVWEEV
jgi:hypothetical protein